MSTPSQHTTNTSSFQGGRDMPQDATTTTFDNHGNQKDGKENLRNEVYQRDKVSAKDNKARPHSSDEVSEKDNEQSFKTARPRSNKDKEEEKEPPMKKQKKSSPSTTASGIIFLPRITRLEAELAAALTTVARLKSELDELKATMAKIASRG